MNIRSHNLIRKAYLAFNIKNMYLALTTFHRQIKWPKAFEGGYVKSHDEVRKYWTRQWIEINPNLEPLDLMMGGMEA